MIDSPIRKRPGSSTGAGVRKPRSKTHARREPPDELSASVYAEVIESNTHVRGDDKALMPDRMKNLCSVCRTIDFNNMHALPRSVTQTSNKPPSKSRNGPFIWIGGHVEVFRFPHSPWDFQRYCPLCSIFKWSYTGEIDAPTNANSRWLLFSNAELRWFSPAIYLRISRNPFLERWGGAAPRPLYHFKADSPITKPLTLASPYVNFKWIREKLATTKDLQQRRRTMPPKTLQTLRLLDCQVLQVVDASGWEADQITYAALSYVWGTTSSANRSITAGCQLPMSELPRTVADAVRATLALGERFLWVDRYCIEQHDSTMKSHQLDSIGSIYAHARVTLVALGPDDATPLPGVSSARAIPLHAKTNAGLILPRLNIRREVENSVWAHRAWTLQEALLSRQLLFLLPLLAVLSNRRDIFPEPVADFDWNGYRAFQITLNDHSRDEEPNLLQPFSWHETQTLGQVFDDYKQRRLSFESDAIDAFRGYLEQARLQSYWGVPLLNIPLFLESQVPDTRRETQFCAGLCWGSRSGSHIQFPHGASHFPSWSWARLRQCAELVYHGFDARRFHLRCEVAAVGKDGLPSRMGALLADTNDSAVRMPSTRRLSFRGHMWPQMDTIDHRGLPVLGGFHLVLKGKLDDEYPPAESQAFDSSRSRPCAILLLEDHIMSISCKVPCLHWLLVDKSDGEGLWHRVGVLETDFRFEDYSQFEYDKSRLETFLASLPIVDIEIE